jgi:hypothetical protein
MKFLTTICYVISFILFISAIVNDDLHNMITFGIFTIIFLLISIEKRLIDSFKNKQT